LPQQVLRQSQSLMNMLSELKWHLDHTLDEWINNAIIRYAQFMRLPEAECVPPVDVDIIWHTHQLAGPKYWLVFFSASQVILARPHVS
jgi:Glycine-rich domain-containing protein-like